MDIGDRKNRAGLNHCRSWIGVGVTAISGRHGVCNGNGGIRGTGRVR